MIYAVTTLASDFYDHKSHEESQVLFLFFYSSILLLPNDHESGFVGNYLCWPVSVRNGN